MILDEDTLENFNKALKKWSNPLPSTFLSHDRLCCSVAHDWFIAMDQATSIKGGTSLAPSWIQGWYSWGPSTWPIYWCDAVRSPTLDCGGLTVLARTAFFNRGFKVLSAQLVLWFNEQDTTHWTELWDKKNISSYWIEVPFVYHELCAVLQPDNVEIRLWDPSENSWLSTDQNLGYSRPIALRIHTEKIQTPLRWGEHIVPTNQWITLIYNTYANLGRWNARSPIV